VALIRKTMHVGGRETCVGLEPQFWACLARLAAERRVSVKALVGQVAAARPAGESLASALRVFALEQAGRRVRQESEPEPEPEWRRPGGPVLMATQPSLP
jgi:predicted DNA-binding ribbon-helix-helix protein